jgi:hypothetical protein
VPGDAVPILAQASGDAHRDSHPSVILARVADVLEPLTDTFTTTLPLSSVIEDDQLGMVSSDRARTSDCDLAWVRRRRRGDRDLRRRKKYRRTTIGYDRFFFLS